jgi:glucose-6-phosphate 1-dehydrogenase
MTQTLPAEQFDCVVFGGTGDLAIRKLLPALYHHDLALQLPAGTRILAVSRSDVDHGQYVAMLVERCRPHLRAAAAFPTLPTVRTGSSTAFHRST